jgi:hypothetical protein
MPPAERYHLPLSAGLMSWPPRVPAFSALRTLPTRDLFLLWGGRDPPGSALEFSPHLPCLRPQTDVGWRSGRLTQSHARNGGSHGSGDPHITRDNRKSNRSPRWSGKEPSTSRPYTDMEYRTERHFRLGACFPPCALALAAFSYSIIVRPWPTAVPHADAIPEHITRCRVSQGNSHPCTAHSPSMVVSARRSRPLTLPCAFRSLLRLSLHL